MARLEEPGVTLNEAKCVFGVSSVEFSGHVLSKDGLKVSKAKVDAVTEARDPKNAQEVRSFLGLAGLLHCD